MYAGVMRTFALVAAGLAVATSAPGTATAGGSAPQARPSSSLRFVDTVLSGDPDRTSPRYGARLASDRRGDVVASYAHNQPSKHAATAQGYITTWSSANDGRQWASRPAEIEPPACRPGEALGFPTVTAPAPGTMYAVSDCASVNMVEVSHDNGRSWRPTSESVTGVADDEGVISSDPKHPSHVYVVSHLVPTYFTAIVVSISTDGGAAFTQHVVNLPPDGASASEVPDDVANFFTPVLVDPRDSRRLSLFWISSTARDQALCSTPGPWNFMSNLFYADSVDGGATWHGRELAAMQPKPPCGIVRGSHGDDHQRVPELANLFPAAAVDAAGNLYCVVSEISPGKTGHQGSHIELFRSRDDGRTFRESRVDAPGTTNNFGPAIVAGDAGHIDVAWQATTAPDQMDPAARWTVRLAQSSDAAREPTFRQVTVSGVEHHGVICPACDVRSSPYDGEHNTVGLTTDPCGDAVVMRFQDPLSGQGPAAPTVARQTGGPRIIRCG